MTVLCLFLLIQEEGYFFFVVPFPFPFAYFFFFLSLYVAALHDSIINKKTPFFLSFSSFFFGGIIVFFSFFMLLREGVTYSLRRKK